jgi:hypothetical protein
MNLNRFNCFHLIFLVKTPELVRVLDSNVREIVIVLTVLPKYPYILSYIELTLF